MGTFLEYQITIFRYPLARYIKYLAGKDLSRKQIVALFRGESVEEEVVFNFPAYKKMPAYMKNFSRDPHYAYGYSVYKNSMFVNEDRTDLMIEFGEHKASLKSKFPLDDDPAIIERNKKMAFIAFVGILAIVLLYGFGLL